MNIEDYADWHAAYRHFNERLFGGALPEVVFALHRHRSARGYASQDRYLERHSAQRLHELAMNPDVFLERADIRCGTCELPMLAPGQALVALSPAAPAERRGEA